MLAARIKVGKKFTTVSSSPSLFFSQSGQKVILNISVELDKSCFLFADDEDHTTDAAIKRDYRDARMGTDLLSAVNLNTIQISSTGGTGTSTFTFEGSIGTKIPGTGLGFLAEPDKEE